ncbi:sulfurtransferase complex subunit TusB [Aliiglaciecola sp. CAU 1673]|uniref:sulfurtransferase complex subunit TusB n=1 Tax=Aliiglaciecola sp. CAU 1673 TaxID=3032595 RepID=UPI0023DCAF5F|nr:sulfurtransferase complex subunit TusB [Aliiglaciecola sp. CAU 1673]MDF2177609.1 sulfurtransferase complex subunit TusB [Aliiglaciecola sp. CAU 1673]
MILHLVKQSPYSSYHLKQCMQRMADGDALLLMQDAVLALSQDNKDLALLAQRGALFVLSDDCKARGLQNNYIGCTMLDYPGFVDLTLQFDKVISW